MRFPLRKIGWILLESINQIWLFLKTLLQQTQNSSLFQKKIAIKKPKLLTFVSSQILLLKQKRNVRNYFELNHNCFGAFKPIHMYPHSNTNQHSSLCILYREFQVFFFKEFFSKNSISNSRLSIHIFHHCKFSIVKQQLYSIFLYN